MNAPAYIAINPTARMLPEQVGRIAEETFRKAK